MNVWQCISLQNYRILRTKKSYILVFEEHLKLLDRFDTMQYCLSQICELSKRRKINMFLIIYYFIVCVTNDN